jgi:carbonic anhydrase
VSNPAVPVRGLCVVTCMDARIDPLAAFGLRLGEAHVVRNAGGVVTEGVLRSLLISQQMLGTREVMLVQHTGCGLLGLDDGEVAAAVERETGARPPMPLGGFSDIEESVRRGVATVRGCAFLPHRDAVRGYVYDVDGGGLREVT